MRTRLLSIFALVVVCYSPILAQEPTPSLDQIRAMSREERIKAHQRRIEQIIQENKRRQEEEARKAAEARQQQQTPQPTPQSGGGVPGSAPPPQGPVRVYVPPQQGARPTPAPSPAGPTAARSEARSILFFRPFDSVVKPGDTFVTELAADTKDGIADEFFVRITFPPQSLNLLAVDFAPIATYLQDDVEYAFESGDGVMAFHIRLQEPQKFPQRAIALLYWEALAPADPAQIRFDFDNDYCDVRLKNTSVLGTATSRGDGVIHANVLIRPRANKNIVEQVSGGGLLVASAQVENPMPSMHLRLLPHANTVEPGEEVTVDVILNNPYADPFDHVQLYLQFDPDVVEVTDFDKGNWIRSGINIEDGFAHQEFAFDFHKWNRADNERGVIIYEEGCELQPLRATGTLARIHLRALRPGKAELKLIRNESGAIPTTNITYLSRTTLADYPPQQAVLASVSLAVVGSKKDSELARRP
ncbi:MAG: cohesin domain-containing protein [Candidatus Sumerlaeaceae bacterium]|jgi:hypothetical protein